jgi:hypothetical protein
MTNAEEHAFAARFGFYRRQVWWIETFRFRPGVWYRWSIAGENGFTGESISWKVPDLRGGYAFRLRVVHG